MDGKENISGVENSELWTLGMFMPSLKTYDGPGLGNWLGGKALYIAAAGSCSGLIYCHP